MSGQVYVWGREPGQRGTCGNDVERAIAGARKSARSMGQRVFIDRIEDDARIATVWPDGKVDLTAEGALLA